MKTLFVLRHAKAEAAGVGQLDVDRGLTSRGKSDADRVGLLLLEKRQVPEAIIASAARRTRKTAKRVAEHSGFSGDVVLTDDLYLAGIQDIAVVIRSLPDSAAIALIVGHNPGFGALVAKCGRPIPDFPTAALAELRLSIDSWSDFDVNARGELVSIWTPDDAE